MGVATAGMALGTANIARKLSPQGHATAYLAANSVVTSVAAAVAPIVGGLSADYLAAHQLSLSPSWTSGPEAPTLQILSLRAWTFFFGLAFVAGLHSIHRLTFVEEVAGTTDRLVLRDLLLEARRPTLNLSSAAGLLRIARLPLTFARPRVRRRRV